MKLAMRQTAEQFVAWAKRKIFYHFDKIEVGKEKYFREKEIWWAALGKNIGYEISGKHELFERPVLIIKKYSPDMCFILPLTTQIKFPKPWYQLLIIVEGRESAINVTQGRTISGRRLLRKMDVLDTAKYNQVINAFKSQFIMK